MNDYDPEAAPDPAEWLALDEGERMLLVQSYHQKARIKLPNARIHAAIHAIIENQIAEGLEAAVRAMARLMKEGLSRHEAVHAIGSVCSEHLFELMNPKNQDAASTAQARYIAAIERLTAESWRKKFGEQ